MNRRIKIAIVLASVLFVVGGIVLLVSFHEGRWFTSSRESQLNAAPVDDAYEGWAMYRNEKYGYSMRYPEKWMQESFPSVGFSNPSDGVSLSANGLVKTGGYYLSLDIHPSINMSLDEWAAWFDYADKNFFDHTTFVEINGRRFFKASYDIDSANGRGQEYYFTIEDNIGYFFHASYIGRNDATISKIMKTFDLTNTNHVSSRDFSGEFISFNGEGNNIYRNEEYGFELNLPKSWKSYYVSVYNNKEENVSVVEFSVPIRKEGALFDSVDLTVEALDKTKSKGFSDCKNSKDLCVPAIPLGQNDRYFFGGFQLLNDGYDDYCRKNYQLNSYFCDARKDTEKFQQDSFFKQAFRVSE